MQDTSSQVRSKISLCVAVGNLSLHPEAGLLFINFATGDTLHLSGTVEIHWDDTNLPGAQSMIFFQTNSWIHIQGALPFQQQGSVQSSPYNPSAPASKDQVNLCDFIPSSTCNSSCACLHSSLIVNFTHHQLSQAPAALSLSSLTIECCS